MSAPELPIAEWSNDGAMRAIEQLARDLPHVDADTVAARLRRLTAAQRAWSTGRSIGRLLPPELGSEGPPPERTDP